MAGIDPSHRKSASHTTHSSAETFELGVLLGKSLAPNDVVCFFGDLGAGKTTMIKGVVTGAGAGDESGGQVTSPTYTYLHIYKGPKTVYHFDLYRLPGEEEFLAMGFDEFFDAGGICCIEWSEKIPSMLNDRAVRVEIEHLDGESRNIRITQ
jgi:tRNA threonylcarbamoyladenosine biosynthesis protein TsaE